MGQINLDNYEPVEERLLRFKNDYPDFRMQSELLSMDGEPGRTRWVVNCTIWKHKDDDKPASNGLAFELDGVGMTQKAAALETCETSALGRALANLGYIGNRRVTREEMMKVKAREDLLSKINAAEDVETLRSVWQANEHLVRQFDLMQDVKNRKGYLEDLERRASERVETVTPEVVTDGSA